MCCAQHMIIIMGKNWWNVVIVCKHFWTVICMFVIFFIFYFPHVYPPTEELSRAICMWAACSETSEKKKRCVEVIDVSPRRVRLLANCRCHGNKATSQGHDLLVGGLLRRQQDVKDWEQIYFVQLWYEIQCVSMYSYASSPIVAQISK